MHKLEYALVKLAESVNDEGIADPLMKLAGASHNYTPPDDEGQDVQEEVLELISRL